jgi:spore coat protein CotH
MSFANSRSRIARFTLPLLFAGILAAGLWPGVQPAATSAPAALSGNAELELFRGAIIPRLQIEIPPEGMEVLRAYRQVWGQPRPERVDVSVTVRDGNAIYTNVALHLKGSYTFEPIDEKPSLTLNFDKVVPGQRYRGFDKIHLNNSAQDPSFLCEKLARELFNAGGVPAPRAGHGRVSLNGRDLGLYVVVEGYNKRFLKRHFQSAKGNLYDGGSGGDVNRSLKVDSGDSPTNRADLLALAAATRETNVRARAAQVEKLVDVDRFLTFAALEVLLLHWDGYCLGPNNFRLFDDTATGRFVFMPHGLDQILGRGMSINTSLAPKFDGAVARALFKETRLRSRYWEHACHVFTNQFQAAALMRRVDQMAARIREDKVLPRPEQARFDAAVDDLKTRIERRSEFVLKEIQNPPRPLALAENATVPLSGWQLHRTLRSTVSGRRVRTDDRDQLEIRVGNGKWAAGSWRKTVLLDRGRYEFSGMARTMDLPANATNGVILRLSGDLDFTGVTNSTAWVTLRHEFEVAGETEEELVCEFRGAEGAGLFDMSSLQLRRLSR